MEKWKTKKKKEASQKKNLDPAGRTPPFRCFDICEGFIPHTQDFVQSWYSSSCANFGSMQGVLRFSALLVFPFVRRKREQADINSRCCAYASSLQKYCREMGALYPYKVSCSSQNCAQCSDCVGCSFCCVNGGKCFVVSFILLWGCSDMPQRHLPKDT